MDRLAIERRIVSMLAWEGPLTFEELGRRLPNSTWNQVFAAVDGLTRESRLSLQRADRFTNLVCLTTQAPETRTAAPCSHPAQAVRDRLG